MIKNTIVVGLMIVSSIIMLSINSFAENTSYEFDNLPKKFIIADNENLNTFTSDVTKLSDGNKQYTSIPVKFASNNNSNVSLKSVVGSSGQNGDYAMQMYNGTNSSQYGSYFVFYPQGKVSTSTLKNERIIIEMDVMLGQSDAEVSLNSFLKNSSSYVLFSSDGIVGDGERKYDIDVWKHILIDANYLDGELSLYYDDEQVGNYTFNSSEISNGMGKIDIRLINHDSYPAAFAFDNVNIYTVAPCVEEISYSYDGADGITCKSFVPLSASQIKLSLNGAFNDANNVTKFVSLTKDGNSIDGSTVSYNSSSSTITITLSENIDVGDYKIQFSQGLTMNQKIGSTTTSVVLPESYYYDINVLNIDEFKISPQTLSAYESDLLYKSGYTGTATMVIAAYKNDNELSSIKYDTVEVVQGINEYSISLNDNSACEIKAFLISEFNGELIPLVSSASFKTTSK